MKRLFLFLCFALLPVQVQADDTILRQQVSDDACAMMISHQPDSDVPASYQAGVDVQGKPVVEADLSPSPLQAPDEVSFDLTVDIAQYLGVSTLPKAEGLLGLGRITVKRDGQVMLDGQPLESGQESALRSLCAEEKAAKTEPKPALDKPAKPLYNP